MARRAALPDDDWLSAEAFAVEEVAAVPLFAGLDSESLRRIAGWARERRHEPGEAVTQRWETARDFYVVMAGRARVEQDGATLAEFGPGEFFGELAALDWGAGYGYSRTATVVATEPLRLLVLSPGHLARLLAAIPEIDAAVRAAVRARLP